MEEHAIELVAVDNNESELFFLEQEFSDYTSTRFGIISRLLSPPTKQITLSVSDRLTKSEIESPRQRKKQISDYAQKELKEKIKDAVRIQTMSR